MTDPPRGILGPGDRAPDFRLPAADGEGTVVLGEYLRRGPVLLTLLRGLYCPFCRRHVSQLRPTCESLRASGIALLGIIIASPERARQYLRHAPACFPMAAAQDRTTHRAYGLPEAVRTPEGREATEREAAEIMQEMGRPVPPGEAAQAFAGWDGFEMTTEDQAEWQRPLQRVGYFLIGMDGVIRWAHVGGIVPVPATDVLRALV